MIFTGSALFEFDGIRITCFGNPIEGSFTLQDGGFVDVGQLKIPLERGHYRSDRVITSIRGYLRQKNELVQV